MNFVAGVKSSGPSLAEPMKQCLVSNLKFDALALGEEAVSLLAEIDEESACLALR